MIGIVGFKSSCGFREKKGYVKFKRNEKGEEKSESSYIRGLSTKRKSNRFGTCNSRVVAMDGTWVHMLMIGGIWVVIIDGFGWFLATKPKSRLGFLKS